MSSHVETSLPDNMLERTITADQKKTNSRHSIYLKTNKINQTSIYIISKIRRAKVFFLLYLESIQSTQNSGEPVEVETINAIKGKDPTFPALTKKPSNYLIRKPSLKPLKPKKKIQLPFYQAFSTHTISS